MPDLVTPDCWCVFYQCKCMDATDAQLDFCEACGVRCDSCTQRIKDVMYFGSY